MLADALETNTNLIFLGLAGNNIGASVLAQIDRLLERNRRDGPKPAPTLGRSVQTVTSLDKSLQSDSYLDHVGDARKSAFEEEEAKLRAQREAKLQAQQEALEKATSRAAANMEAERGMSDQLIVELRARVEASNEDKRVMQDAYHAKQLVYESRISDLISELSQAQSLMAHKESLSDEHRDTLRASLEHESNMRETEREVAAKSLLEKQLKFDQRCNELEAVHALRIKDWEAKCRTAMEEKSKEQAAVAALRQQLLEVQVAQEEKFAQFESTVLAEQQQARALQSKEFQSRIDHLCAQRDELDAKMKIATQEHEKLNKISIAERTELKAWIERGQAAAKEASSTIFDLQAENSAMQTRVSQVTSERQMLNDQLKSSQDNAAALKANHKVVF